MKILLFHWFQEGDIFAWKFCIFIDLQEGDILVCHPLELRFVSVENDFSGLQYTPSPSQIYVIYILWEQDKSPLTKSSP